MSEQAITGTVLPFPPSQFGDVLNQYADTVCLQAIPFGTPELSRLETALKRGQKVRVKAKLVGESKPVLARVICVDSSELSQTGWVAFTCRYGELERKGVIHAATGFAIMGLTEVPPQ